MKRLLLWREVANVIYLFSDSAKCAEAEILALTLTAVLLVPELAQPVKYSILFAWAYVESLADVRALLNGGKVPLMKAGGEWKTSIQSLIGFTGGAGEGEKGVNLWGLFKNHALHGRRHEEKLACHGPDGNGYPQNTRQCLFLHGCVF